MGGVVQSRSGRVLRDENERAGEWLGEREREGPARGVRGVAVVVVVELLELRGRRAVRNEDDGDEFDAHAAREERTSTARFVPSGSE